MGGGMMGMGGGGFFSIPPDKTVQIPLTTVCLEHGKAEPRSKMTYRLIKLEDYTSDSALQELLEMVGSGKYDNDKAAAQAATWNLANKMSWETLASKEIERLGGVANDPYFTPGQMEAARQIVALAQGRAREREKASQSGETGAPRNRVPEKKS